MLKNKQMLFADFPDMGKITSEIKAKNQKYVHIPVDEQMEYNQLDDNVEVFLLNKEICLSNKFGGNAKLVLL